MTKTLVNPSPRPVRVVLVDGTEHVVPGWGMVRVEQPVQQVEPARDRLSVDKPPEAA